jgi:hypothetical protein
MKKVKKWLKINMEKSVRGKSMGQWFDKEGGFMC